MIAREMTCKTASRYKYTGTAVVRDTNYSCRSETTRDRNRYLCANFPAMKHIVDIETWERRDNYAFFRNFLNPWIAVATEIDCTEARTAAKATGRSFFLYYLYAIVQSVNEIREFRYRTDSRGNVVYHDTVDVITPIAVPGRTFHTVRIPYHADFGRFYEEARAIVTNIPQDGDPYGAEKALQAQGDYDVFLLSATPELYFTALTYAQAAPGQPTEYPLMNAGKAVLREGRLMMPFSIFVNHAFVDGAHISRFFTLITEHLRRIAAGDGLPAGI